MLPPTRFTLADAFMHEHARPVDLALWRRRFGAGTTGEVHTALWEFQTEDGGFGKALEPDLRAPESSVLATQTALHVLEELGDPGHELVTRAIDYLIAAYLPAARVWRFTPATAGDHPHAPWWDQPALEETFDGFLVNPRANVLGYLLWAAAEASPGIVDEIYDEVLSGFHAEAGPIDVNALGCYRNLVAHLPATDRPAAVDQLVELAVVSVERDVEKWQGYCLRPLDAVSGPDDPVTDALGELVDLHLDYEIDRQLHDGSWRPTWSWFGHYPDVWPSVEVEWAGEVTYRTMLALDEFGRIAH